KKRNYKGSFKLNDTKKGENKTSICYQQLAKIKTDNGACILGPWYKNRNKVE
ncbi:45422_t:CDS:1, partial [Gigaspora margarita]